MERKVYAGAYPVGGQGHVNVPLSNFAVEAFATPDDMFIADRLFPVVPVQKQSDRYYEIMKDEFFRVITANGTLRAPKTKSRRIQFTISSNAYYAHNYALSTDNALEDLANADMAIRLRQNSTRLVVNALKLDQEIRIANIVTSISNVGSGVVLSGASQWSDPGSDPIGDINAAHAFMRSNTGLLANTAVIDWDTMQVLRRHPAVLDMFKYTSGGLLTEDALAGVFGVERILTPRGIKNVGKEGQVPSMQNIWGHVAVLVHVGENLGMQSTTFGVRFRWQNGIFPNDFGVMTDVQGRAGEAKIEVVEAGYFQDEKVIAPSLAYAITDTIA